MHPRFLHYIERLSRRPHGDRQMISLGVAFAVTAVIVGGRFTLFPLDIGTQQTVAEPRAVAGFAEAFSTVTDDLNYQIQKAKTQLQGVRTDPNSPLEVIEAEKPATVPLVPSGSGGAPSPGGEWVPSAEGYYYEYPTGASPADSAVN